MAVIADDYFETVYFDEFSQEKSRLLSCVCYIVTNDSALTFKLWNFSSHLLLSLRFFIICIKPFDCFWQHQKQNNLIKICICTYSFDSATL